MVSVEAKKGCGRSAPKTDEERLKRAFICSPFHPMGKTEEERQEHLMRNIECATSVCREAMKKGYVPYAPHLYFPQFLSEDDKDEREMGIILGLTWLSYCDEIWVVGLRISSGMKEEIKKAREWGSP